MDRTGFIKLLTNLENPALAAAAGRQLAFALKGAGLTWEKIVSPNAFLNFTPSAAREPVARPAHLTLCEFLLGPSLDGQMAFAGLRSNEKSFIESISKRDHLTEKQSSWFLDIAKRFIA